MVASFLWDAPTEAKAPPTTRRTKKKQKGEKKEKKNNEFKTFNPTTETVVVHRRNSIPVRTAHQSDRWIGRRIPRRSVATPPGKQAEYERFREKPHNEDR